MRTMQRFAFAILFVCGSVFSYSRVNACKALQPTPSAASLHMRTPKEAYRLSSETGVQKVNRPLRHSLLFGILSGAHLGFGAYLLLTVGGQCHEIAKMNPGLKQLIVGAVGFPFAVTMTTSTGGEIFTGDLFFSGSALYEGRVRFFRFLQFLLTVHLGNMIGGLLMAKLATIAGTLPPEISIAAAKAKTSLPWASAFVRGLLCSTLICMACFNSNSAQSFADKAIATFYPISAFNSLGFENSVSNMFTIPFGIMNGADVSIRNYLLRNLFPVTLGNIVGGLFAVALPYFALLGEKFSAKKVIEEAPRQQSFQNYNLRYYENKQQS